MPKNDMRGTFIVSMPENDILLTAGMPDALVHKSNGKTNRV